MITALDEKGVEASPQWEVVPSGLRRANRVRADWRFLTATKITATTAPPVEKLLEMSIPRFLPFRKLFVACNSSGFTVARFDFTVKFLLGGEEVYSRALTHLNGVNPGAAPSHMVNCFNGFTSVAGEFTRWFTYLDGGGAVVWLGGIGIPVNVTADTVVVRLDSMAGSAYGAGNEDGRIIVGVESTNYTQ